MKKMESWLLFAFGSGIMFGLYNIFVKMYSAKTPSNVSVMIIGLGVFLCGLVYLLFQKDAGAQVNLAMPVLGLILLSAVIWFVGTVMQVISWADAKSSLAIGAVILTVGLCLTTTIAGVLIFGETFTNTQLAGMALAIAGTVLLSL